MIPVKTRALPGVLLAATLLFALLLPSAARAGDRPLQTGVFDSEAFYSKGDDSDLAYQRIRNLGARWARIWIPWDNVAPRTRTRNFHPRDPADPLYSWDAVDGAIEEAHEHGVVPLVVVFGSPTWAHDPDCESGQLCAPYAGDFADFAHAAARRFNGDFRGLPRVKYWQAWNEANIHPFFRPQYDDSGEPISPEIYREMLNSFAAAVKAERPDNLVLPSALAPVERPGSVAPMEFMRRLLCMSGRTDPYPSCDAVARFDIWATHPYTPGSPTRPAAGPDDATLTDLPEMSRLLRAANRAGHIDSAFADVPFWVTEFSWDSQGPDPEGVPLRMHARWTAEALYRMWRAGVSNVFWFLLRDQPGEGEPPLIFQSGLFFRGARPILDTPKPAARAFHFPFVALPSDGRVQIWGRTPSSSPGLVQIQIQTKGGWRTVKHIVADQFGVFARWTDIRRRGWARAIFKGRISVPFQIARTPPTFQRPFGRL